MLQILTDRVREKVARKSLQKGDWLRLNGQPVEAVSAYHQAISFAPGEFAAHFNLAETLSDLEQWQEAVDAYAAAHRLNPASIPVQRGIARALYRNNDYSRLLESEFDALESDSEFFQMYDSVGDALFKKNEIDEATAAYARALTIMPNSWQAHQKLARAQLRLGQTEAAELHFRRVIELQPGYSWAHDGLGDCCRLQYRWEEAARAYRQASVLDPDYHWHYFKLGEVLMQSAQWDEAENAFDRCYQLDPYLPGLEDRRAEVAFNQAQWTRLEDYCARRSADQEPDASTKRSSGELSVLLIATQPPCPPSGGALRLSEEIRYLGARHRLAVLCFHYSEYEADIEALLRQHCEFHFLAKPGGRIDPEARELPIKVNDLATCNAWQALQRLSRLNFDVVLFDFIYAASYRELFADSFTVLQEHNIESRILQQMSASTQQSDNPQLLETLGYDYATLQSECERLFAYESETWPGFDLRTTTSELDRKQIVDRCGVDALVVPNGVDTRRVIPVERDPAGPILFVGHMSYAPNMDAAVFFVENVLPLLQAQDPAIRLVITGRKPHESVMRLAENPNVDVIADPAEVQLVANACSMSIVPLRMGSGTRLKILESFAMSLPVVSTSLGCEGLPLVDEEHLLIRNTPVEFAEAILRLRADEDLAMKLRINARRLVKSRFDWTHIYAGFENEILARLDAGNVR